MSEVQRAFSTEYEDELSRVAHTRFLSWTLMWLVLLSISFLGLLISAMATPSVASLIHLVRPILEMAVVYAAYQQGRRLEVGAETHLRLAFWVLVINTAISSIAPSLPFVDRGAGISFAGIGLLHLLTALLLPWTPRQALQQGIALWAVWMGSQVLLGQRAMTMGGLSVGVLSLTLIGPGLLLSWARTTQFGRAFEERTLRRYYSEIHRELFDARKIHEAIFPKPILAGPIRLSYVDASRVGIGGDYLSAHLDPQGRLNASLINVSGDGIAAALSVHRIQAEIERLFAEAQELSPLELTRGLDRYCQLTLAPLTIFASLLCVRLAPDGAMQWIAAGYAPGFIRRSDGRFEVLRSSTWLLGAADRLCDSACESTTSLLPGDQLVVSSDGAWRWRNPKGYALGIAGVERIVRTAPAMSVEQWPAYFMECLVRFAGDEFVAPPADVLAVTIGMAPAEKTPQQPSEADGGISHAAGGAVAAHKPAFAASPSRAPGSAS